LACRRFADGVHIRDILWPSYCQFGRYEVIR